MGQMGMDQQAMNVNQDMLRPVLQNVTVLLLFVLPAITMRTYSEERRSRHHRAAAHVAGQRLCRSSSGKFLGALALYAVMLAVTLVHIGGAVPLRPARSGSRS